MKLTSARWCSSHAPLCRTSSANYSRQPTTLRQTGGRRPNSLTQETLETLTHTVRCAKCSTAGHHLTPKPELQSCAKRVQAAVQAPTGPYIGRPAAKKTARRRSQDFFAAVNGASLQRKVVHVPTTFCLEAVGAPSKASNGRQGQLGVMLLLQPTVTRTGVDLHTKVCRSAAVSVAGAADTHTQLARKACCFKPHECRQTELHSQQRSG